MNKTELKKIIREELKEAIPQRYKGTPHQFGSDSKRDLETAKAKFSNAVLALDGEDEESMALALTTYQELGDVLESHIAYIRAK